MAEDKSYLRAVLSEARSSLPAERASALSTRVQQRLLAIDAYVAADRIALYVPFGREVDTALIASETIRTRRALLYPLLDRARGRVTLGRVKSLDDLRPGPFGILQPSRIEQIEPRELGSALVCVPGLAFTPSAARLGRGGGYYDRLITALPAEAVTAGLGYSFQLIDWLPEESHDRRLNFIVTESAVYSASAAPRAAGQAADQGGLPRWAF